MAHGHFARMGGFVVELLSDTPSIVESTHNPETVSVRPQHLLDLVRPQNPAEARFDLLQEASKADIEQVHNALSTNVLTAFLVRLIPFVWYSVQRRRRSLEISPLEVFTVAHVFMAVCIQIFWWDKPQYLRRGIALDRSILCKLTKDFDKELEAAARKKHVAEAYPFDKVQPDRLGLVQWHQKDDNHLDLRIHATYRDMIVSFISICHAVIMILPHWDLKFETAQERDWWWTPLIAMVILSALLFVLMSLDLIGRKLSERPGADRFRKIWGAKLCGWDPMKAPPGAAAIVRRVLHNGLPIFAMTYLALTSVVLTVAVLHLFERSHSGILVAGPGDW